MARRFEDYLEQFSDEERLEDIEAAKMMLEIDDLEAAMGILRRELSRAAGVPLGQQSCRLT